MKIKSKAQRRLERLPDVEILNWCDQAGSGMAKALDDYRRLRLPESLEEAKLGAETLLVAIDVLKARRSSP